MSVPKSKAKKQGFDVTPFKDHVRYAALKHDDIGTGDQLWLVRLPKTLKASDLNGVSINLNPGNSNVMIRKQKYAVSVTPAGETGDSSSQFHPLLPSVKRNKLKLSHDFSGQVSLSAPLDVLTPVLPPIPERPKFEHSATIHATASLSTKPAAVSAQSKGKPAKKVKKEADTPAKQGKTKKTQSKSAAATPAGKKTKTPKKKAAAAEKRQHTDSDGDGGDDNAAKRSKTAQDTPKKKKKKTKKKLGPK
ncbi:hypothetical protein PTSG_06986 [Salpingoeca rosetta]|uniref:Uncharacterized protein n=1 Tax=Salpingoeca rosetta (strain ATCC 50818 / BSB-021) TaxID=946362 RepID=F2UFD7_SALR5|nr:uncharacterized protein PTSG_06986 [Salpingoeca rosetta]EGD75337.1 hypothetical protein PTSG_06986 [Salpingoeca rosetta]|eukprot:XP_004992390.1 hypothetical protein PTSG_06986 [Salpingoeca rosetta]